MAKSKSLSVFDKFSNNLEVDIKAHCAADSDSIEVLLAKKAAVETILAQSKATDAELLSAHEQATTRSIKLENRFNKLSTKHARRMENIHQHEEFVGRLATQVLGLKHEVESLKHAQSPRLVDTLVVANFKWYELTRYTKQLVRMRQVCRRSHETLEKLNRNCTNTNTEEMLCSPFRTSSKRLIEVLEIMLDDVMKALAQRGWEEGSGDPGAEDDDDDDKAGEPEAVDDGKDAAGEDVEHEREEPVSPVWPTR